MSQQMLIPSENDRLIIDKMADYVVRNGSEFLEIMMERQKDNPKYQFMWPDCEHYSYFKHKVEQAATSITSISTPSASPAPTQPSPAPPAGVQQYHAGQLQPFLPAETPPLLTPELLSALSAAASNPLVNMVANSDPAKDALANALEVGGKDAVEKFSQLLSNLMNDCSSHNIKAGRAWVLDNCRSPVQVDAMAQYLHATAIANPDWSKRLHLVYLLNDVFFHTYNQRWVNETLLIHLGPLLQLAYVSANSEPQKQDKILKVLSIWEKKTFFDQHTVANLRIAAASPPVGTTNTNGFAQAAAASLAPLNQLSQLISSVALPNLAGNPLASLLQAAPSVVGNLVQSTEHIAQFPQTQNHTAVPDSAHFPQSFTTPQQNIRRVSDTPVSPARQASSSMTPRKKYFELPAGLMVAASSVHMIDSKQKLENKPYQPIVIEKIQALTIPAPQSDLVATIDEFYEGLEVLKKKVAKQKDDQNDEFEETIDAPDKGANECKIGKNGWEAGYLDDWYRKVEQAIRREEKNGSPDRRQQSERRQRGKSQSPRRTFNSTVAAPNVRQDVIGERLHTTRDRSRSLSASRSRGRRRSNRRSSSYSDTSDDSRSRSSRSSRSTSSDGSRRKSRSPARRSRGRWTHRDRHRRSYSRSRSPYRGKPRSKSPYRGRSSRSPYGARYRREPESRRGSSGVSGRQRSRSPVYRRGEPAHPRYDRTIGKQNVGYQMMKKLGWSEGRGLGADGREGIVDPIQVDKMGDKYAGLGVGKPDSEEVFEQWRQARSYNYLRDFPSARPREPIGCFRCGKHDHIARDCPGL